LERTFVLSRSDPKENLYFTVTAEGATKDWTILNEGTKFTMPAGEKRFPITVAINIPKDVANGEYKGGIRLVSSPNPNGVGGNGASTALAVLIQTDFTIIGDQVLEYDISSVGINNFEEGSPLDISMTIINSGNVNARPSKVSVEIYDKFNKELLESHNIIEMGSVAPFTTGDIIISIPVKLERDQYWARVSAYKNENLLKEEKLTFEIVEVGSLQKKGELKEILYTKKADIGETVKITGVFENTGKANYSAKLVAEIYKNDKMVKMIESDLATINIGQTENLFVYFTPEVSGIYTVKARVVYAGAKTPEKEFIISVGNIGWLASVGLSGFNWVTICVILFSVIIVISILVFFKKKKYKK